MRQRRLKIAKLLIVCKQAEASTTLTFTVRLIKDCWIVYKRSAFIHISIIACEPIGDDEIIVARNREIGETKTAQNGLMAINLKAGKCVNYPDIHRERP